MRMSYTDMHFMAEDMQKIVDNHKAKPVKPRRKLAERIEKEHNFERYMWISYGLMVLTLLILSPLTLVATLPLGGYLFYTRQKVQRVVAQRDYDAMVERYNAMDAPTVQIPVVRRDRGKHAAA